MFSIFTPTPLPICLATGISCAFVFMRGLTILPGLFLGTGIACWLTFPAIKFAFLWSFAYSLQAVALYVAVQRFIFPTHGQY